MRAQDILQYIDSLENVIKSQTGREKVLSLLNLSDSMFVISFDKGIATIEQAEREAWKNNDSLFISQTNLELAEKYINYYDLDLAEPCLHVALAYSCDNYILKYDIYRLLAYLNLNSGKVDTSFLYCEKALEAADSLGRKALYVDVLHNMALLNRNRGCQEEALRGFKEAVVLYYEIDDSLSAARSLNNIAMIYFARKQYDEAMSVFNELMPFFERSGEYEDLSMLYNNVSMICSEYNGNIDTAEIFLEKAKHYANINNDSLMMVDIWLNEGNLYLKKGEYDSAFGTFENALCLASRLHYNEGLAASYFHVAKGYCLLGDYANAFNNIMLCMGIEGMAGAYVYTPLLKTDLLMCYAHLGKYDSLESELARGVKDYNKLLSERQELEKNGEDAIKFGEENEALKAKVIELQYVAAGLATLLVALLIYTIISGRPKKEK